MRSLILMTVSSTMALANEDKDHSHSLAGELEHAWPIVAIFIVLTIAGFTYNYFSKKNN